jgi:lipopolysaccharide transport system ATP-binding protein
MSYSLVKVENVCKTYTNTRLYTKYKEIFSSRKKQDPNVKVILDNISFEIKKGESIALIGKNGAGKSTLLKILAGVVKKTSGEISITGKLNSILELGMGFHPEFTCRENAIMGMQLQGLASKDVITLLPSVIKFSELEDYIDLEFKRLSSGMQMRLAFSVATAVRPDILIIDEALSVGDAKFQYKSFSKIRDYKQRGTTLILVSHDTSAIRSICDRAILLEAGKVVKDGDVSSVLAKYNFDNAPEISKLSTRETIGETSSGDNRASITRFEIYKNDIIVNKINVGDLIAFDIDIEVNQSLEDLNFGFSIKDKFGNIVYGTNTYYMDSQIGAVEAGKLIRVIVNFKANLGTGIYVIQTALHSGKDFYTDNYEWKDSCSQFEVVNSDKNFFIGTNWISPSIEIYDK